LPAFRCTFIALVAFAALPAAGAMAQQNAPTVSGLQRANNCGGAIGRFGFFGNPTPAQGTITMANDGGWCWIQFSFVAGNMYVVPDITTTRSPRHGTLVSGGLDTGSGKRVRLAYKPAAGFAGTDNFAVHIQGPSGTNEAEVVVTVTK
jgi:hypothetical protein